MNQRPTMSDKKKFNPLPLLLTIVVLVLAFVFVLPRLGDYEAALRYIETLSTQEAGLIILFTCINIIVYVFPYMAALRGLRYLPAFVLRQTSFMIANALPAGGAIGYGVQYMMLKSYNFSGPQSTAAITITGVWNMLATVSMPAVAAIVLLASGQIGRETALTALVAVMVASASYVVFYLIVRSQASAERIGRFLERIVNRYKKQPPVGRVSKSLVAFQRQTFATTRKRWVQLVVSNFVQQMGQFSVLYVALLILSPGDINFATALAVFSVARLGTFIPLTPAGVGTVDTIMVGMLVQAGVSGDEALAATLIWRSATFLPQMLLGAFTFLYWRLRQSKINMGLN